jgi:hypothetical protein
MNLMEIYGSKKKILQIVANLIAKKIQKRDKRIFQSFIVRFKPTWLGFFL